MLHAQTLFAVYHSADQKLNDARHLAYMIALFGPPPLEYLKRSDRYLDFWDEHGKSSNRIQCDPPTGKG